MNKYLLYILLIFPLFICLSCSLDERQAEASIEGTWHVTHINSYLTKFYTVGGLNGSETLETIEENGDLGSFIFSSDSVAYNFIRHDTIYQGKDAWTLTLDKVNQGFTRVNQYTLDIDNHFTFDVTFGDDTKNAEKNATEARFIDTPTDVEVGVIIDMQLTKN